MGTEGKGEKRRGGSGHPLTFTLIDAYGVIAVVSSMSCSCRLAGY